LRPAPISFERLIKPPAEIFFLFGFGNQPPIEQRCGMRGALLRLIPALLPRVEAYTINRVDVGGASDLVMTKDSRLEKDPHRVLFAGSSLEGKAIQQAMQLVRKLWHYKRISWRRIDSERQA
jgi:hypothetical protein